MKDEYHNTSTDVEDTLPLLEYKYLVMYYKRQTLANQAILHRCE